MATGKSRSHWFAAMAALLMTVNLSGCFDKEGDRRKASIDFLQNTAMCNGEHLPTLTVDQKKQFGPFVPDHAAIYGYSQQMNQAMDAGPRPAVDNINAICVLQNHMTQRESLRQANGALGVSSQQPQNAKVQADATHNILKQAGDLKLVFDQVCAKVVTAPTDALQPLVSAAQIFTQQPIQVRGFVAQRGTQVSFVTNGIQFPTSQQASQYNALTGLLAAQHQALSQA